MLPGSAGLHVPWRAYGTHAYLVSPRGARNELLRTELARRSVGDLRAQRRAGEADLLSDGAERVDLAEHGQHAAC